MQRKKAASSSNDTSAISTTSKDGVTRAELAAHNGDNGIWWTAIGGMVYDISEFYSSHPGGDIVRTAGGRDASTLFECYHPGVKMARVNAVLDTKCKKVGPLIDARPPGDNEFYRTVQERVDTYLAKTGQSRHHYEIVGIGEIILTLIVYTISTYYTCVIGSVFAAACMGILTGRLGFIMHCGNHMATSNYLWVNKVAGYCMEIAGASHLNWYHEHQVAHHMDPNEPGKDNDCTIGKPYLRFHPDIPPHPMQKWQHITTFIGMSFGFYKWFVVDFFNFWSGTVGSVSFHVNRTDWYRLLFFKSFWVMTHFVPSLYYLGAYRTFALMPIYFILGAQYLENIFIVNHIQEDLAHPPAHAHWANKQVLTSSNWASGSVFWNWFSGGLNHQIEHHLFPSISIYIYPHISHIVRDTCKEYGLPYHSFSSFPKAWLAMQKYLYDLGHQGEAVALSKLCDKMKKGDGLDEPSTYLNQGKDVKD